MTGCELLHIRTPPGWDSCAHRSRQPDALAKCPQLCEAPQVSRELGTRSDHRVNKLAAGIPHQRPPQTICSGCLQPNQHRGDVSTAMFRDTSWPQIPSTG